MREDLPVGAGGWAEKRGRLADSIARPKSSCQQTVDFLVHLQQRKALWRNANPDGDRMSKSAPMHRLDLGNSGRR